MTLNEIVEAAKASAFAKAETTKSYYHTYIVPGRTDLSVYVVPTQGYLTARKQSLRVQFQIHSRRVSKAVFEAAL